MQAGLLLTEPVHTTCAARTGWKAALSRGLAVGLPTVKPRLLQGQTQPNRLNLDREELASIFSAALANRSNYPW